MQIEVTTDTISHPLEWLKLKTDGSKCWQGWQSKMIQLFRKHVGSSYKCQQPSPQGEAISFVAVFPPEVKYVHTKTCAWMFVGDLSVPAASWKQPRCPWVKMWCIHTVEYYTAVKRLNGKYTLQTWMGHRDNTESDVSQGQAPSWEVLEKARTMLTEIRWVWLWGPGVGVGIDCRGAWGTVLGLWKFSRHDSARGDRTVHIC